LHTPLRRSGDRCRGDGVISEPTAAIRTVSSNRSGAADPLEHPEHSAFYLTRTSS